MKIDLEYLDFVIEGFSGNIWEDNSGLFIDIMLDDKKIGSLEGIMFFNDVGDINALFTSMEDFSTLKALNKYVFSCCSEIAKEIFIKSKYSDDDYTLIWDEEEGNCFKLLIIERIFIEEKYRGMGIMKLLLNWIYKVFNVPMVLKAFPLQYSIRPPKSGFTKANRKVIDAYLKCGFKRIKPKSDILYAKHFEF